MTSHHIPYRDGVHPVHCLLLAFPIALFPSGLVSDITYLNTTEMQWSNFAAWLIAAGTMFAGLIVVWILLASLRNWDQQRVRLILAVLMFFAGLVNSFQHSRDGWSSVGPFGLALSILSALLALILGWITYRRAGTSR